MQKDISILIFCKSPEMCDLMKKYFDKNGFPGKCIRLCNTHPEEKSFFETGINNINDKPDYIIYDEELGINLIQKIKDKFIQSEFFFIPALTESEQINVKGIRMHEPFKLSELENIINRINESRTKENV